MDNIKKLVKIARKNGFSLKQTDHGYKLTDDATGASFVYQHKSHLLDDISLIKDGINPLS